MFPPPNIYLAVPNFRRYVAVGTLTICTNNVATGVLYALHLHNVIDMSGLGFVQVIMAALAFVSVIIVALLWVCFDIWQGWREGHNFLEHYVVFAIMASWALSVTTMLGAFISLFI